MLAVILQSFNYDLLGVKDFFKATVADLRYSIVVVCLAHKIAIFSFSNCLIPSMYKNEAGNNYNMILEDAWTIISL